MHDLICEYCVWAAKLQWGWNTCSCQWCQCSAFHQFA